MSEMTITTIVEIDAPASQAWKLFGEGFGSWADWAPGIDKSTMSGPLAEGAVRVNETPSLGTVRQELVRFDRSGHALAYEMRDNLPPFFSRLRNDWTIQSLSGDRCRLEGEALFELRPHAVPMRDKLESKMGMTLEVFAMAFRDRLQDPRTA